MDPFVLKKQGRVAFRLSKTDLVQWANDQALYHNSGSGAYGKPGTVRPRSSKDVQTVATRVRGNARIPYAHLLSVRGIRKFHADARYVLDWTRHAASLLDRRNSSCRRRTRRRSHVRCWSRSRPKSTVFDFARQTLMSSSYRSQRQGQKPTCCFAAGAASGDRETRAGVPSASGRAACPHDQGRARARG